MGSPRSIDDNELAARLKAGDESTHVAVFDRYAGKLLGYLIWLGVPREDAEDLLNEIFGETIREIDDFDPKRGSLRQWIYTRATWRARDHRRHAAPDALPLEEDSARYEQRFPSLHEDDPPTERQAIVRKVLDALPERYRVILELRHLAGWPHKAIADYVGITEGNARVLLVRAESAFKRRLRECPQLGHLFVEDRSG